MLHCIGCQLGSVRVDHIIATGVIEPDLRQVRMSEIPFSPTSTKPSIPRRVAGAQAQAVRAPSAQLKPTSNKIATAVSKVFRRLNTSAGVSSALVNAAKAAATNRPFVKAAPNGVSRVIAGRPQKFDALPQGVGGFARSRMATISSGGTASIATIQSPVPDRVGQAVKIKTLKSMAPGSSAQAFRQPPQTARSAYASPYHQSIHGRR